MNKTALLVWIQLMDYASRTMARVALLPHILSKTFKNKNCLELTPTDPLSRRTSEQDKHNYLFQPVQQEEILLHISKAYTSRPCEQCDAMFGCLVLPSVKVWAT